MNERKVIVAFLTGQSHPRGNALSPVQRTFLEQSPVPAGQWLTLNFPYRPSPEWREVPLLRASFSNARQYLRSRKPAFPQSHRAAFQETFADADAIILLTGSCGLELLANLELPEDFRRRLHVVAYGPVSRSVPACASVRLVQGTRDSISRLWHRQVHHIIPCGHMDYLETAEMKALFAEVYQQVTGGRDA